MSLPPKTTTYPSVDIVKVEMEVEKTLVKLRWEAQSRTQHTRDQLQGDHRSEKEKHLEDQVVDPATRTINLAKMRATDFSTSRDTCVPDLGSKEQEQSLQDMKSHFMNITKKYIAKHCDPKGKPRDDPIPKEVHQGIKEVADIVKGGTHVYFKTDKSGKGSLNSIENYYESASKHTGEDPIVGPEVLRTNEITLNCHTVQLGHALGLGSTSSKPQGARIKGALTNINAVPPKMYCAHKDHKTLEAGQEHLGPPGRPICGAREAPNGQLSSLLSKVINTMCDKERGVTNSESGSTEDVLSAIDSANAAPRDDWVLGSMDVSALYPSLNPREDSVLVGRLAEKHSDLVEGVVWPEVARYLTLTHTEQELKDEGLTDVCWTRKFNRGNAPGITTTEVDVPLGEDILDQDSKLNPPQCQPDDSQKAKMLGKMISTTTRTAMETYTYQYRGDTYWQQDGGPIGNPLSSAVARVVMIDWDQQFLSITASIDARLETLLNAVYKRNMDDQFGKHRATPPGYRWCPNEGVPVYSVEDMEETEGRRMTNGPCCCCKMWPIRSTPEL